MVTSTGDSNSRPSPKDNDLYGPFPRFFLAFALTGLTALTASIATAEPFTVPFDPKPGESQQFEVRHLQAAVMGGQRGPVVSVGYQLQITVESASETGSVITALNSEMDATVDRNRFVGAPRFRYPGPDVGGRYFLPGSTSTLRESSSRCRDWATLRDRVKEQAIALAGDRPAMAASIDPFLNALNEYAAVQLFARPMAMAASARLITFEPPDKMSFRTDKMELPSFATYAPAALDFRPAGKLFKRGSRDHRVAGCPGEGRPGHYP